MELNINDKLYGFTVTGIRDISEFEGQLIEMIHDKTGAGLVWAKSKEENKLFSVGFRTLPEDNTGVFHILEHSVLCGSDRFPVREPFVELLKTSMNTFLNAMTYSDKTLYPVSSRMEQDYLNLTEVYLDAVFRPAIMSNPNIFYQEGWHIDTLEGEPAYKGVVFNEMKGAMSDVDQVAERTLGKLLFPDTCYGYNSGGDPDAIPDLTYEDFISRYKRFYHPSNSYFYLDGDIPLERTLELIDSYLSEYDHLDDIPSLDMQEPVKKNDVISFTAADEDSKAMIVYGRIAGTWADRDKLIALSVLTEQLADSNESPLKRAVLSSGIAEDMEIYVSDGIAQPYVMIIFRGIDPSAAGAPAGLDYAGSVQYAGDRLMELLSSTAEHVISDGLSERDLQASINQLDFRFRQYPEPQGLYRANAVFNSWLYGGDPALYLKSSDAIAAVRAMVSGDDFNELAKEYFINTSKYSQLTLLPSATLGEENSRLEAERVSREVSALTEEERSELDEMNRKLLEWQATPDSEEALATIPVLDIKDIKDTPELIGTDVGESEGIRVIYHPVATNGIVYINAYFPVSDLKYEELPAAALITEFYKDLPTENYSVTELQNELRMYVGSMSFGIDIIAKDDDNNVCRPCLRARASVLKENLSHAEDLLIEIMTRTRFDDKALMKELLTQIDEEGKRYAVSSGHRLAVSAARSHYSSRDAAGEAVNGITFIRYMHDMSSEFDNRIEDFCSFARDLISRSIVKNGAVISVTASEPADISGLTAMIPEGSDRPEFVSYKTTLPEKLGIQIPASVSHSVIAYDLNELNMRPHGSVAVAANILSLAYLWNEIRVKGGAYGANVSANRSGSLICYSFRDPTPARSVRTYRGIPEFLSAVTDDPGFVPDGFIISTVATTEPLISPAARGRAADDFWFSGFSDEDRIRIRREILNTGINDLKFWIEPFREATEKGCICVIGPASALQTCPDLEIINA